MARRVARRRQDAGVIADRIIVAHDLGLLGLDDRQHAVGEGRHRRLGVLLGPVIELALGEHVARVRKGRHPAAVFQPRVPADVIDMQMRAHHVVDVADGKSGRGQRRADRCRRSSCSISAAAAAACRCRCSCRSGWCDAASSRHRTGSTGSARPWRRARRPLASTRRFSASTSGVRPGSISSAGRKVVSCSMMRWMVRSPTVNLRLMKFLRYAGGGTEIFTDGRSSIFWWKASSFG